MKLRTKFIITLVLLGGAFILYVHLFWMDKVRNQMIALSEQQYHAHLRSVAEGLVPQLLENQLANVYETLNAHAEDNPEWKQIVLTDGKGAILYPLDPPGPLPPEEKLLTLSEQVGFMQPYLAELTIVVDLSETFQAITALENDLHLALAVMMLLFLCGLWVEIELIIRRPVDRLVLAYRELAQGNFQFPVQVTGQDEIAELMKHFIKTRDQLQKNHLSMQDELESHRRKAEDLASKKELADFEASHDPLTRILNRRGFDLGLRDAFYNASEFGESYQLLHLDLDRFKEVNDKSGHAAGDELLKEVVALIANRVRKNDLFARLGGDEFALILSDCERRDAEKIAAGIIEEIDRYKFYWEGEFFKVGVSIGIAEYTPELVSPEIWLNVSDMACYMAKAAGRGCFKVYERGR